MEIEILRKPMHADWVRCLTLARATQGKLNAPAEVSEHWKLKMLEAEHSPVRTLMYTIEMRDIPYYCSVHFSRHKIGAEHYVSSQRRNPDRGAERQDAPVTHIMDLNFQALVAISRKRLCTKADPVTRQIMQMIVDAMKKADPITALFMAPECEYRGGFCHEFRTCGRAQEHGVQRTRLT